MGLLDLPASLFAWLDGGLSGLMPPAAKLVVWAGVGALVSMELYRLLSPQGRIGGLKLELEAAQRRLSDYDGSFAGARPLLGRMLGLALRRVAIVLPSTLIASLPLLLLIIWLDQAYGGAARQAFIGFGPEWLRGWEVVFFPALILFAVGLKVVRRIE